MRQSSRIRNAKIDVGVESADLVLMSYGLKDRQPRSYLHVKVKLTLADLALVGANSKIREAFVVTLLFLLWIRDNNFQFDNNTAYLRKSSS